MNEANQCIVARYENKEENTESIVLMEACGMYPHFEAGITDAAECIAAELTRKIRALNRMCLEQIQYNLICMITNPLYEYCDKCGWDSLKYVGSSFLAAVIDRQKGVFLTAQLGGSGSIGLITTENTHRILSYPETGRKRGVMTSDNNAAKQIKVRQGMITEISSLFLTSEIWKERILFLDCAPKAGKICYNEVKYCTGRRRDERKIGKRINEKPDSQI